MTVDRGGLEYSFVSKADLAGIDSFIAGLERVKKEYAELAAALKQGVRLDTGAESLAETRRQILEAQKLIAAESKRFATQQVRDRKASARAVEQSNRALFFGPDKADFDSVSRQVKKENKALRRAAQERQSVADIVQTANRLTFFEADKAGFDSLSRTLRKESKQLRAEAADRKKIAQSIREANEIIFLDADTAAFNAQTRGLKKQSKSAAEQAKRRDSELQEFLKTKLEQERIETIFEARNRRNRQNRAEQDQAKRIAEAQEIADKWSAIYSDIDQSLKKSEQARTAAEAKALADAEKAAKAKAKAEAQATRERERAEAQAERDRKRAEAQALKDEERIRRSLEKGNAEREKAQARAAKIAEREREKRAAQERRDAAKRARDEQIELKRRLAEERKAAIEQAKIRGFAAGEQAGRPKTEAALAQAEAGSMERVEAITRRMRELDLERVNLKTRMLFLSGEELAFAQGQASSLGSQLALLRAQLRQEVALLRVEQAREESIRRQAQRLAGTSQNLSGLSGTIFRIAGALVFFETIRQSVGAIKTILKTGVQFRLEVERAETALAGIIAQTVTLRDAYGAPLKASEAFAAAQEEAARQTRLLQKDALRTTATFRELLDAFQVSFAFGVQAGFDPDQIRQFAVQISQAATLFGLEQQQLAEEVRSILQGTIRARDTRIATALGITNEQVRNAREAGTLFEFLQGRFDALGVATESLSKRLFGLFERLRDAVQQGAGEAATSLFSSLERAASNLLDRLISVDGEIESGFVRGLEPIFRAASVFVDDLSEKLEDFSFEDLRKQAEKFAPVLQKLATAFLEIATGIAKALPVIGRVLAFFAKAAEPLGGLERVAQALTVLFASLAGIKIVNFLAFGLIGKGIELLIAKWGGFALVAKKALAGVLAAASKLFVGFATVISNPLGLGAALIAVFTIALKSWTEDVLGFELTWRGFVRVLVAAARIGLNEIADLARNTLGKAEGAFKSLVNLLFTGFQKQLKTPESEITEIFDSRQIAEDLSGGASQATKQARADFQALLLELKTSADRASKATSESFSEVPKQASGVFRAYQSAVSAILRDIEEQSSSLTSSLAEASAALNIDQSTFDIELADDFTQALLLQERTKKSILELDKKQAKEAQNQADRILILNSALSAISGVRFGFSLEDAELLARVVEQIADTAAQTGNAALFFGVAQIVPLVNQILASETELKGIEADRVLLNERINALLADQATLSIVAEARNIQRSLQDNQTGLDEARTSVAQNLLTLLAGQRQASSTLAAVQSQILAQAQDSKAALRGFDREIERLNNLLALGREAIVTLRASSDGSEASKKQQADLEKSNSLIEARKAELIEIRFLRAQENALILEGLELEEKRASILAGAGSVSEAANVGLQQFVEGLPTVNQAIAQGVQDIGQASVQSLAGGLRALLSNDIGAGLQQVAFGFANSLLDILTTQLAQILFSSLFGVTSQVNTSSAIAAQTLAAGGAAAGQAIVAGAVFAARILAAGSGVSSLGGLGLGGAQGGLVGYAQGGFRVHPDRPRLSRAPAGFDRRDVYPALLRAWEYVMRPEATRAYGPGVMQAINDVAIPPAALRAIAGASNRVQGLSGNDLGTLGAAFGGAVAVPSQASNNSSAYAAPAPRGSPVQRVYLSEADLLRGLRGRDRIIEKIMSQTRSSRPL